MGSWGYVARCLPAVYVVHMNVIRHSSLHNMQADMQAAAMRNCSAASQRWHPFEVATRCDCRPLPGSPANHIILTKPAPLPTCLAGAAAIGATAQREIK